MSDRYRHLGFTLRGVRRHPGIALIQVIGLSVGFLCFLVGFGTAHYWSMSDRQYVGSERTYVLTQDVTYRGTPRRGASPSAAYHLAKYVRSDIPELDAVARAVNWSALPVTVGERTRSLVIAGAEPDFFRIFRRSNGGPAVDALQAPRSVVLTTAAAERLYGSVDVVGRTLRLNDRVDLSVTGIFEPLQPSHIGLTGYIRFDLLVSWDVIEMLIRESEAAIADESNEIWIALCCVTYVQLPPDGTLRPQELERRLQELASRRIPAGQRAFAAIDIGAIPLHALQSTETERLLFANSGIDVSLGFSMLALASVVLIIACLNYANLASAQVLDAERQLGVRRVLGASRWMLAVEHLFQSALFATAALSVALLLLASCLASVSPYLGVDPDLLLANGRFWACIAAAWVAVTCFAGAAPAWIAFSIPPRAALHSARDRAMRSWRGSPLVVGQFFIASLMISIVIVVRAQHRELERIGLGDTRQVVAITNDLTTADVRFETLRTELLRHPQIESVSATSVVPWEFRTFRSPYRRSSSPGALVVNAFANTVWHDYFETMHIDLLAGRTFSADFDDVSAAMFSDPEKPVALVIDAALCSQLGFPSPQAAIDQLLYVGNPFGTSAQSLRIIGVVASKPMHFVGGGATAGSYQLHPSAVFPLIRTRSTDMDGALRVIDDAWKRLAPRTPLRRQFVDELFSLNYGIFERINRAFDILGMLALGIACLGLVGFAMHRVRARIREIGIRRTLGASAPRMLAMLVSDFSRPVLLANLLALPFAVLAAEIYLSVFIHRLPLSGGPFFLSLAATMIAAWVAVAFQAVRAARLKPASVLRQE
ncbi:MAG TPA: ABC transporter permease [Povalibacter sp.]|uniref:ABC transporter permease n=1 Tax=Povalibacter sp. TaxID=1962978 RepID=UPI002C6E9508|nr:ABC transporter permease [Povalibacter sp.]HMN45818.1 ABC transporter permease [Povalibacter sp.]